MAASRSIRADAARNRDAIITAARTAFDRGEFDRRFDDFASLAGVGTGTLYRHFPTREALAEAVYHEEVAALCERAEQLLADQPPAQALEAFLHDFIDRMAAQSGLARTLANLIRHQTDTQADGGRKLEEAVIKLVAAARQDDGLTTDTTAGAVITALHGIGSSYGRPHWQDDAENLIAILVRPPQGYTPTLE